MVVVVVVHPYASRNGEISELREGTEIVCKGDKIKPRTPVEQSMALLTRLRELRIQDYFGKETVTADLYF